MNLDSLAINSSIQDSLSHVDPLCQWVDSTMLGVFETPVEIRYSGIPRPGISEPWMDLLLLFCVFALGVALRFSGGGLIGQMQEFFKLHGRVGTFDEAPRKASMGIISFTTVFLLSCSFFLFYLLRITHPPALSFSSLSLLGWLMVSLVGYGIFKFLTFRFLGYLFFKNSTTTLWVRSYFWFYLFFGAMLFPVVVGLTYLSPIYHGALLSLGGVFFLFTELLLLIKSFQIFLNKLVSVFYLILYLCALEILPLLLLYKLFLLVF